MSKQLGACAFSNACNMPGERQRDPGTNRYYCPPHFQTVASTPVTHSISAEAEPRISVKSRRGRWPLYVGAASGL